MLCEALAASGRWHPIVVVPREGPLVAALERLGVEVHRADVVPISRASVSFFGIGRLLRGTWRATGELDRIVAGRPISLVHSNTIAVLGGALWAKRRRRPHLWHVHEIILSPAPARSALPWLVRTLADRVIANSHETLAWLLRRQPALEPRATVVWNGVPAPAVRQSRDVQGWRQRLGARDGDVLVALVGRLNHWKGHRLLMEAVARLPGDTRARLRVAIVGSPSAGHESIASDLIEHCRRLNLMDCVTFVPFTADIWPLWHATDIAVVPSTEPEPFGLVAIEAMACGVPVVASRHGGLLDIIVDGHTGLLVAPGDAVGLAASLTQLAEDATLRRSLGEAGRVRQRALFSVEAYAAAIAAVYEEIARPPGLN
jgi:glycosyltransferase involved in cell wall biosynthesis